MPSTRYAVPATTRPITARFKHGEHDVQDAMDSVEDQINATCDRYGVPRSATSETAFPPNELSSALDAYVRDLPEDADGRLAAERSAVNASIDSARPPPPAAAAAQASGGSGAPQQQQQRLRS